MTSLGKRCHTTHLDAAEITVGYLSVASSNMAACLDFTDTILTTTRLSTGTIDLGDYEVTAPSGGTFAIKDGGSSIRFALSSGGAFLQGYQPQLTVGGAEIPTQVLNTFHLNLDDSPSLTNSLVTAGALSHYIENDLQPVLLTAPAGSQGGVRASAISLTTPSSLNVPSCKAVLDLMNNQENALYRGLIGVGNQIGYINGQKIPALQETISVNNVLISSLESELSMNVLIVSNLDLSLGVTNQNLLGVANQIGYINGTHLPVMRETISVNNVLISSLESELSLNALSVGELSLSVGAMRSIVDLNTSKANLLGTLYTTLETELSVQRTTLSTQQILVDLNNTATLETQALALSVGADVATNYLTLTDAAETYATREQNYAISSRVHAAEQVTKKFLSADNHTVYMDANPFSMLISNIFVAGFETNKVTFPVGVVRAENDFRFSALDNTLIIDSTSPAMYLTDKTAGNKILTSAEIEAEFLKSADAVSAYTPIATTSLLQSSLSTVGVSLSVQKTQLNLNTATVVNTQEIALSIASTYTPLSVSNFLSSRISSLSETQNNLQQTLTQVEADVDELETVVSKNGNASQINGVAAINMAVSNTLCAQFDNNRIILNSVKVYKDDIAVDNEIIPRGLITSLISVAIADTNDSILSVGNVASATAASSLSLGTELGVVQQSLNLLETDVDALQTIINTSGNATQVTGVSAVNIVLTETNEAIARFKPDRLEVLQDIYFDHANPNQPSKIISTDNIILEAPGLYKDSDSSDDQILKKSDIDALITQRLNAAFLVTNQIGLPSSTECIITRESVGEYLIQFVDSWNVQFSDINYSIILQQRSIGLGVIPKPSGMEAYFTDKASSQFRIVSVEQEDSFPASNGTDDMPRDPGRLDFACFRGMICFAQGSFNASTALPP